MYNMSYNFINIYKMVSLNIKEEMIVLGTVNYVIHLQNLELIIGSKI